MRRIEWKDASSWSKSDHAEVRATPKTWSAIFGDLRVTVTRHIAYPPDIWILQCHDIGLPESCLLAVTADQAKAEAIRGIERRCEMVLRAIREAGR